MQASFSGTGTATFVEQSGSFQGVRVTVLNSAALTTAQLESATILVNLQRNGQSTPIVSGPLYAAALANDPTQLEATAINVANGFFTGLYVDFGGTINLKGNDNLQISVSGNGFPTSSTTVVSSEYSVGVETYTPSLIIYQVDKTRANNTLPAFDNVNGITFIQSAAPGAAVKPLFTGISINADKWQASYNLYDIFAMISQQWDTAPTSLSFFAYVGEELDKMSLTYNIDTTSTNGNGYICIFGGQQTDTTKARAKALISKIAEKQAQKFN
jgi:hypothetical protein